MAGEEKDASIALIAARDPQIRGLVEQGFEFVTNAFKAGAAPPGMQGKTDREAGAPIATRAYRSGGCVAKITRACACPLKLHPTLLTQTSAP